MAHSFRHTASFGKRIEYWIIGQMLKEGLDVYVPLVDDDAIDAVIRSGSLRLPSWLPSEVGPFTPVSQLMRITFAFFGGGFQIGSKFLIFVTPWRHHV
jgi:hypothetical protein